MTPVLLNITHINQTEIQGFASIMFDLLAIDQDDSKENLLKKFEALKSFKSFLKTHINFHKLTDRKSKVQYIDFIDKLNQQIEELEKLSGLITQEELDVIANNFAKKMGFPVGIYDE